MDIRKHHRRYYMTVSLMTLHIVNAIELRSQLIIMCKALATGCGYPRRQGLCPLHASIPTQHLPGNRKVPNEGQLNKGITVAISCYKAVCILLLEFQGPVVNTGSCFYPDPASEWWQIKRLATLSDGRLWWSLLRNNRVRICSRLASGRK